MSDLVSWSQTLRIADLPADRPHGFAVEPDAEARGAIARALGVRGLRKLRLRGEIAPLGRADWRLTAVLGATVVQDCVVTLAPVTTRIDAPVARSYLAEMPEVPTGDEIETPDDDSIEPLTAELDLGAVMVEALALALPDYPHAEGVDPFQRDFTAPGVQPMSDAEARPFAGLRDRLDKS